MVSQFPIMIKIPMYEYPIYLYANPLENVMGVTLISRTRYYFLQVFFNKKVALA